MFKLAEMFVEIQAKDDPLKASIEKLKGSMGSMASSLGGTLGGVFTGLVGGPIGLAMSAVQGLFSLLEDGSESVSQLGEYWESTFGPIKEMLTGVVNAGSDWIASLAKTIKESEMVVAALAVLDDYASAAFENIKIAIDRGVEVFNQFWAAAKETGQGVVIIAGQIYESIQQALGGSIATAQSWGETIQTWVIDKAELAGIFIRNWPDFFEIAGLKIKQTIINIGEYMGTIPENAAIVGNYLANNWVKLVVDSFSAIGTAFVNLGTNLKSVWEAFLEFLRTGKFEVNFKPLLEGFIATADAIPKLMAPKLTDLGDEIRAIEDRIARNEKEGFLEHKRAKKPGEEAAAAAKAGESAFKSETFGVAEFASKIRAGILNKEGDAAKEKALAAAERTAKATEKLVEESQKPKPARVA
jgi:hypothetical protein